ncbi:MAG: hypothetical protein ABWZ98_05155 [Nakamurella sp.]
MTTAVEEVLRRHGYAVSEDALAGYLDALLGDPRAGVGTDMSAADAAYLVEYAGVRTASDEELAVLDERSAGRAAAEAGRTLSRGQVAELLHVDPSRVSHQVTGGRLFSYPGGNGRPVFPDWQFADHQTAPGPEAAAAVLPHLDLLIAAIPAGSHPVAVRTFMTTPSSELVVRGRALSPLEWLRGGGGPVEVTDLAVTLGEQV